MSNTESSRLQRKQLPAWKQSVSTEGQRKDNTHTSQTRLKRKLHLPRRCLLAAERSPTPVRNACKRCDLSSLQQKGHYSSHCLTKRVSKIGSENVLSIAFLDTVAANQTSAYFAIIELNEQPTSFKLDTGAEVTAISEQTHQNLCKLKLLEPEEVLYGSSQLPLKTVLGKPVPQRKGH